MGKIIAIVNQKGGVGKTTTAINISAALGKAGKKILLIDFDPQGNLTSGITKSEHQITNTAFDWVFKNLLFEDCVSKSHIDNIDLLPSQFDLSILDILTQSDRPGGFDENGLKRKIDLVKDKYDFVFLDCSPSMGTLNKSALIAADSVIIPIQTEMFAIQGINQLLSTIRFMQKNFNDKLKVEGIIITMFDKRLTVANDRAIEIKQNFGDGVFKDMIPKDTSVSKSQIAHKSLFDYDPWAPASIAYYGVAKELLDKSQKINDDEL